MGVDIVLTFWLFEKCKKMTNAKSACTRYKEDVHFDIVEFI